LIGVGLMMRSFFVITHVDLGFNPKNVLVAGLSTDYRHLKAVTTLLKR